MPNDQAAPGYYDPATSMVATSIGEIPESDLDISYEQQMSDDTWVVARIGRYKGAAFPANVGEVVRRDVWVTVKRGQGVAGVMGGAAAS